MAFFLLTVKIKKTFNKGHNLKNRRKLEKFFLFAPFQIKFIIFFILSNMIAVGLSVIGVVYFFSTFINKGIEIGIPKNHIFFRFIDSLVYEMSLIYLVVFALTLLATLVGSYVISHKISGPLYRLKMHLKNLNEEEKLTEIHFRKGDYTKDIENEFNKMVQRYSK